MDLRKLPRPSASAPQQGGSDPAEAGRATGGEDPQGAGPVEYARAVPVARRSDESIWLSGPEALLYAGVGVIICFMVPNPFRLVLSLAGLAGAAPMGTPMNLGPGMVAYEKSIFFLLDAGPALLGVGLIMEAVALAVVRKEAFAWAVVGWSWLTAALSGLAFVYVLARNQGPQFFPLIAAIVAAYVAWALARRLQHR